MFMAVLFTLTPHKKDKKKKRENQPYSPAIEESLYINTMEYFVAINTEVPEEDIMVQRNVYNIL